MASPHLEKMVAEIRRKAGDEIANRYRELCAEIHACSVNGDYAGMRAVVLKAKDLLKDVGEKRQQQDQQQ